MERIIIDMDEVIADPMGEMIDWYRREYNQEVDYSKMIGSWLPGFPEQYHQIIWNRILSEGFFRHLPVIKDSVRVLEELNKQYEVFIVSAATEFPNSLKDKHDWLMEHFPFFSWKQLVLCGDKRLITGDYMIDDYARNLVHFMGKKYLFTAAHNLHETGYDRINSWEDAAEIFLKLKSN